MVFFGFEVAFWGEGFEEHHTEVGQWKRQWHEGMKMVTLRNQNTTPYTLFSTP
jgi:hypothetical protein